MARTAKKAKAVTVATVERVAADAEIRSVGEAMGDVVALPAPNAASVAAEAANTSEVETTTETVTGREVLIPLNKLKKSPRNARKTPHGEETVETYAASIAAKGILQNLVVEPELDANGTPTGFYFVTIGEGRRLAQMLRAKRKEVRKTEPIRCVIDTANDPFEISLDENVSRTNLPPADQFEAFLQLSQDRGWGAEEIAARFGVTAHVVKQRLKLGAVSPKLMQVYRYGLTGDNPPWKPVTVYDDGRRVYVEFPRGIVQGEMPPIFAIGPDGEAQLVNARIYRHILIVDRLFGAAELRLGSGDRHQKVRISRADGRPQS